MKFEIELLNYDEWTRTKIIEKITDSKLLDEIARIGKTEAHAVAENINTSAETLSLLAKHKNSYVRIATARNKNVSIETLAELAEDEDPVVKASVAANHKTTVELLYKLEKEFTAIVLMNPNITKDSLLKYKDSKDKHLRKIANKRLRWLENIEH